MKKVLKAVGIVIAILILAAIGFWMFLRITMFDPAQTEEVEYTSGTASVKRGEELTLISFNIGYGGYASKEDFFMDGGKGIRPESKDDVMANLSGIASIINEADADVVFIQEADVDSLRSYHTNEVAYLSSSLGKAKAFTPNFDVSFVPYPIPPVGKVYSGLVTYTDLTITDAVRLALPNTMSWYIQPAYIKRCMLVERTPVEGTDHELVLINLHMEAYTDEEKRDLQMVELAGVIKEEYDKGNYVIVGGDFNQEFEAVNNPPVINEDGWLPGQIFDSDIPEGFSLAVADNAPTCRSLQEPFVDNDTSQVYIIDGFIVSDNIEVKSVEVKDYGFANSDHNPVILQVRIK